MIVHLSSEQLAECISGQPSLLVSQHVEGCPVCRAELANFREVLNEFRTTVRDWSEDQAGKYQTNAALVIPAEFPESRPWKASRQLGWALLFAAVCIVASFVLPRHAAEAPGLASSDVILLNQVDAQVSRTVPSSMEPLMKLVVQTNPSAEKQE